MRLIDADKLCLNFNDWQLAQAPKDKTGYEPCEYTSHDMQLAIYETIDEAMRGIDEQPQVEAIPVIFLEHLADILDSDEIGDWSPVEVIRLIIDAWKECNGNKGSD